MCRILAFGETLTVCGFLCGIALKIRLWAGRAESKVSAVPDELGWVRRVQVG